MTTDAITDAFNHLETHRDKLNKLFNETRQKCWETDWVTPFFDSLRQMLNMAWKLHDEWIPNCITDPHYAVQWSNRAIEGQIHESLISEALWSLREPEPVKALISFHGELAKRLMRSDFLEMSTCGLTRGAGEVRTEAAYSFYRQLKSLINLIKNIEKEARA